MQEEDALDFYKRITEGTKRSKEIDLTHESGATLSGVEMHPVSKQELGSAIQQMPDELFESAEDVQDVDSPEELEDVEQDVTMSNAVSEETIQGFTQLCKQSLDHPDLTKPQLDTIVEELDFNVLFEVGSEVIELSYENTGSIRSFQKQA